MKAEDKIIERLQEYIDTDISRYVSEDNDFIIYCNQHCDDIAFILLQNAELKEEVKRCEKVNVILDNKCTEASEKIRKAIEIIDFYNLGKFDYSIPTIGVIELLELFKGSDVE